MARRRKKQAGKQIVDFLMGNILGNIILFLLLFFILLGINLLFSRNDYYSFALLFGLEVILAIPLLAIINYWRKP